MKQITFIFYFLLIPVCLSIYLIFIGKWVFTIPIFGIICVIFLYWEGFLDCIGLGWRERCNPDRMWDW